MPLETIPPYTSLQDQQFITVAGPDGITTNYFFDAQQRALYFKESQVIFPQFHGQTHIAEDPVPNATCDTPGLQSADDKCKLDALLQMRLGVLGWQGAGFASDGGFMCFPASAPVLMPDGRTRPIGNLDVGDVVVTHTGDVQPVLKKFRRQYNGKLLDFSVSGHRQKQLRMTPEHPVLAVKNISHTNAMNVAYGRGKFSDPTWIKASELSVGDYVARRLSISTIINVNEIHIEDYVDRVECDDDLAYSTEKWNDNLGKRYNSNVITTFRNTAKPINSTIKIGPEFLRLCGYYLSEGHTDGPIGRPKEVVFSVHINEAFGDLGADIAHCCEVVFGVRPITQKNPSGGNGGQLVLRSALAARFIKSLLPGNAHSKYIPQWIMELPLEKQRWLITAFIEGDGSIRYSKKKKHIQCGLCNEQLINQLAALLERQNCTPIIDDKFRRGKSGKLHHKFTITIQAADAPWLWLELGGRDFFNDPIFSARRLDFSLHSAGYTLRRINKIKEVNHCGFVYNIAVNKDNSYIINGSTVHNCGDIILAAGSGFLTIERIGNIVRFDVQMPLPFSTNCSECAQLFWIQDPTEVSSIMPPICNGTLPGENLYGELKVFLFPQTTIVDPTNPTATLNNKNNHPALVFKRYSNSLAPDTAEFDLILKRDAINNLQTEIGWSFTPGTAGAVQCVYFMGKDNDGNQTRFDLTPEAEPNLLGTLLYNGHLISRRKGVIVGYTTTALSTNQYTVRNWDIDGQNPIGDPFTARNVWQYANPENPSSGNNPKTLLLDSAIDLLPIGTLVDIWFFKVGEVAGEPIRRYYFSKKPSLNPNHMWAWIGQAQFGDLDIARSEVKPGFGSGGSEPNEKDISMQVSDIRNFERSIWGLTGYDDPLLSYDMADPDAGGTFSADISIQHRAVIDTNLPGLRVIAATSTPTDFSERPVWLWNRVNLCNALVRTDIGRPQSSLFSPYDIVLRAPIDEYTDKYMRVVGKGTINKIHYARVAGVHFHDLPRFGAIRILSPRNEANQIFNYNKKAMFPSNVVEEEVWGSAGTIPHGGTEPTGGFKPDYTSDLGETIVLLSSSPDNLPYPGAVGDIIELLHQEYNSPIVRAEFTFDPNTGLIELQFKVGILDMSKTYEQNVAGSIDDFARGLTPGYTVSAIYSQNSPFTGVGTQPQSSPDGFIVYDGGAQIGGTQLEFWNNLEIMIRDNQIWIWWNKLLIPPSPDASAALPLPVTVSTPYFPIIQDPNRSMGKIGMRLWPSAAVRRIDVRSQLSLFSEFTLGQLSLV